MAEKTHIQYSFHAGEWAPALNARVDMAKYHSAAALLRNFFVDYRGGASTCPGTKYCLRAKSIGAWLIPFQAAPTVGYMLEFGQNYVRFYSNGAPILESGLTITGVSGNTITVTNTYSPGDWVYVLGVGGVTNINGKYFIVATATGANITVTDLYGATPSFSGYTSGGTTQRVYTVPSPYNTADLPTLKYAQNGQFLVLTHQNYVPYVLTLISATNWTLVPITFGSTIGPPAGTPTLAASTALAVGTVVYYGYVVTAVDKNGQESAPSAIATYGSTKDFTQVSAAGTPGTITVSWAAVPGAVFYNVYRAQLSYNGTGSFAGASFGFLGFATTNSFNDTAIVADYSLTPPIAQNPFQGAGVASATVTAAGAYTTVPGVTFAAAPGGGSTATGVASLGIITLGAIVNPGFGYNVGQAVSYGNGVVLIVKTLTGGPGTGIASFQPLTYPGTSIGSITAGSVPANPIGDSVGGSSVNVTTWGVTQIIMIQNGAGYTSVPAITFSAGAAAATAVLGPASSGNPTVPVFFDKRLGLFGPPGAPNQMNFSIPGSPYNFNTTNPVQADDAITANLISKQLQYIKGAIAMPSGLLVFTNSGLWQINGGSSTTAITPINIDANPQSYVGSSDLPPIIANFDMLYVQAKGSIVRDATFNFYANVWTGTDVSVLSSHLFYTYSLTQWAWAEEPFKIVWAVRNDGVLLSLTFLKEQEIAGWAHRDTQGSFLSVATITEPTATAGNVDAVYVVVSRIDQVGYVQHIERMAERAFPYGMEDAWCVDSALQSSGTTPNAYLLASTGAVGPGAVFTASSGIFNSGMIGQVIRMGGGIATITAFTSSTQVTGTITQTISQTGYGNPLIDAQPGAWTLWQPSTTFSGLDHLNGQTVVGLADGVPVGPFTVVNGSITLPKAATKVVIGLSFVPQLQTLSLDLGEPTVQGKRKKIAAVTARVKDALGLSMGSSFTNLVPMKDLVLGNVGSATNATVTNLQTCDARTLLDPLYQVPGQYCFQQNNPLPASILGVIPEVTVGDK
jgi:hypothetical protein